jgi:hypothetical protein
MSYTVQYRITSITNPDKVYAAKQDFWDDHSKIATIDKSSIESGKVESYNSELDAGGKSITKTMIFVDEDAFNAYIIGITNLLSSLGIELDIAQDILDDELNFDDELHYTKIGDYND